jgi:hypothetical protein
MHVMLYSSTAETCSNNENTKHVNYTFLDSEHYNLFVWGLSIYMKMIVFEDIVRKDRAKYK